MAAPLPDRRRVNGPAETFQPVVQAAASQETQPAPPVLDKEGRRADRRTATAFREIFVKTGAVPQANGSAYIELDKTKVICAVYGPRQAQRAHQYSGLGQLQCSLKFAPFSGTKRRSTIKDPEEIAASADLARALTGVVRLDTFPKAVVDLFVTVLEDDGAVLAASISCASLALVDAGIEMSDMVAACSVGVLRDTVIVDYTASEQEHLSAHLTVGHQCSLNETSFVSLLGDVTGPAAAKAIDLCVDGAAKLYGVMQECVVSSAEQRLKRQRTDSSS